MAEISYFILDDHFQLIAIGEDVAGWIAWHIEYPHLGKVGEKIFPGIARIITWFFGAGSCLWETLIIPHDQEDVTRYYYDSYYDAVQGHQDAVSRMKGTLHE